MMAPTVAEQEAIASLCKYEEQRHHPIAEMGIHQYLDDIVDC
jgi:hypothetical protein